MKEMKECPICGHKTNDNVRLTSGAYYPVNCQFCGNFIITYQTTSNINFDDHDNSRAILRHWVRKHQGPKPIELTFEKTLEIIKNNPLPDPTEQLDNFILFLGSQAKKPSASIEGNISEIAAVIGSVDEKDVKYHLNQMRKDELIYLENPTTEESLINHPFVYFVAQLTHLGWTKYGILKREVGNSNKAFMAMKFGDHTLDKIYNEVIKDAVSKTGFEIRKLDEEPKAGLIDNKLRVEIRRSKFMIADLSHDNNGAYWEAGFAEGLGIPVIYICEEEKFRKMKTHFDTNHHLTVQWKDSDEHLKIFVENLKATIRATFPNEAKLED